MDRVQEQWKGRWYWGGLTNRQAVEANGDWGGLEWEATREATKHRLDWVTVGLLSVDNDLPLQLHRLLSHTALCGGGRGGKCYAEWFHEIPVPTFLLLIWCVMISFCKSFVILYSHSVVSLDTYFISRDTSYLYSYIFSATLPLDTTLFCTLNHKSYFF